MCKKILKNYFREAFYFSTLILIFVILSQAFFERVGSVLVDCGREAYIPEQVLRGKVLFKDIFILYGPLSYQINALLYKIFGIHLNTLYFAGVANSFLILSVFYRISRKLTSLKASWLASFLLMTTCIFYYHITGYIFPYSYAAVYGLSAFLISVLFCIYYLENSKPTFLIAASFFMGISTALKLDFIVFSVVLILTALYFKPLNIKNLFCFFLAYLFIPAISWGILFIKGLELNDLLNYLSMMNEFVNSHLFKYFYQEHTGLYPTHKFLWALQKVAWTFIVNFSACMLVFYSFFFAFSKIPGFKGKGILEFIAFVVLYILFPKDLFKNIGTTASFGWIAVGVTLFLILFLAVILIKNGINSRKLLEIQLKDRLFIVVSVAGILSALKSYFFVNLHVFGTFFAPLLILVFVIFLYDKIPQHLGFIHEKAWKYSSFTVLFLLGIVFMLSSLNFTLKIYDYPLKTGKGRIYTQKYLGVPLNKLISFIEREVPPDESFVMMPEGLMINFLTGKGSNNRFYSLTPNFVEAFENKIIENLKIQKPGYIFITNQDTNDYGFSTFGNNYAKEIYKFIQNNYKLVQKIEEPDKKQESLKIKVYKLRTAKKILRRRKGGD